MGVSERATNIPPFIVMDVLERAQELAAQGKEIIHLEVGRARLRHPGGDHQRGRPGHPGRPHPLHPLPGAHRAAPSGVQVLCRALWGGGGPGPGVGDRGHQHGHGSCCSLPCWRAARRSSSPDPHYACYDNFISFVGGAPVRVPVRAEEGFPVPHGRDRRGDGPGHQGHLHQQPLQPHRPGDGPWRSWPPSPRWPRASRADPM